MSTEFDYAWADFLHPQSSTTGMFGDHSFNVDLQGETAPGPSLPLKDPEPSQEKEISTAYAKLKEYATTNQPSRPSSPSSTKAHEQFIQNLGHTSPYGCDRLVLDGQLSIS